MKKHSEFTIKNETTSVERGINGVNVISDDKPHHFDQVIFACHADEALALIENASIDERAILSCLTYEKNTTYLHTDESLMPRRKKAWSSWNYLATTNSNKNKQVTVTYWMNHLQKLSCDKNYMVTLNPYQQIDSTKVIQEITYHHPIFDRDALYAQSKIHEIQGKNKSWFCGSYTGYGFHEDALSSSVRICEELGVIAPWNEAEQQVKQSSGSLK